MGLEDAQLQIFFSLAPDGGEWLISRVGVFSYGETAKKQDSR